MMQLFASFETWTAGAVPWLGVSLNGGVSEWVQEEVVMKRCWLARYWALAVKNGKHKRLRTLLGSLAPVRVLTHSGVRIE